MEGLKAPSNYVYPNDMCELIRDMTKILENETISENDKKKIWDIVNNVYDQWTKVAEMEKEKDKKDYYKIISLLTLLMSTNWFTEEQEELELIVNEIYYNYVGLAQSFPEEDLVRAVQNSLGAEIKKCTVNKGDLTVEFAKGDYGEGPFNGKLVLDLSSGLFLHKENEVLKYNGKLPVDAFEIELALSSFDWKQHERKKR
ncbi:conserved Plasmodium protein, unknown function [Plasmodium vivax]|uniref:Uncharacterized protein n=6 Tax=Plasmodium vivax TaxID=5855 RepID=A5K4J3_PLAVS|nr:hypothetical protein, conserved [Plasmodium vivax]KMZ80425.1 hypothetical protein PVIIG_03678 [Plasmodium vivax India VII]KMZ84065.1 hypothetical protein PVBG_02292 [Plasmodium vivax Brazil I]KMZ93221.1 hypothetical protein PVMG_04967 [Plasmodium vivax Mauritania I]KMZ99713.1 hypothetical protein PVNG_03183 [Plasmodium vivax North Korean]EDL45571.1 hypothetical protein, conserved [Plasmodium vivax]|eukprot:XP_001615298.1 hypothetical protein [Plasmodium vivax Sal-1]